MPNIPPISQSFNPFLRDTPPADGIENSSENFLHQCLLFWFSGKLDYDWEPPELTHPLTGKPIK